MLGHKIDWVLGSIMFHAPHAPMQIDPLTLSETAALASLSPDLLTPQPVKN